MKREKKLMWGLVLSLALVGMVLSGAYFSEAGDLDPPAGAVESGAPVPTMHTLGEIYTKLGEIDGKLEEMGGPPAPGMKTGQTTSYASGDDGDLEKG